MWLENRSEKGQTLVVISLLLVVLVGFLALLVDLGALWGERRQMQNAADAAVLAGTRELALGGGGEEAARQKAEEYAFLNLATACEVAIEGETMTVTATKRSPTFFAGILGIKAREVKASAKAAYFPASAGVVLVPLAVAQEAWSPGGQIEIAGEEAPEALSIRLSISADFGNLPESANPVSSRPSRIGWLNLDQGHGQVDSRQLECWVCPGTCPLPRKKMTIGHQGTWVEGVGGVKSVVIRAMGQCLLGERVVVCVYDAVEESGLGRARYRVVGFTSLRVTSFKQLPRPIITGSFAAGPIIDPNFESGSAKDFGLRTERLVR